VEIFAQNVRRRKKTSGFPQPLGAKSICLYYMKFPDALIDGCDVRAAGPAAAKVSWNDKEAVPVFTAAKTLFHNKAFSPRKWDCSP
jgi:hypothetical protein